MSHFDLPALGFSPIGSFIYNKTDGEGWCFTAYCNLTCSIEKLARPCHSTTPPVPSTTMSSSGTTTQPGSTTVSTITGSTATPFKNCSYLKPPRKVFKLFYLNMYINKISIICFQCDSEVLSQLALLPGFL